MSKLEPALEAALMRFAAFERVLVALDFDGTMAPLVDRPEDARPLPESAQAFAQIGQRPGILTAVVSGRNLESLEQVYAPPRPKICIGSHGSERLVPEDLGIVWENQSLTADQSSTLSQVTQRLEEVASTHANVSVEYKPSAGVLHVRQAVASVAASALEQARTLLKEVQGVNLLEGKAVLEATVHHGDKGQSVQWLRDVLNVQAVLFIGDDVTDENGFKVLHESDVGIKVGTGPTAAEYRIPSPLEVPDVLKTLLSMRD